MAERTDSRASSAGILTLLLTLLALVIGAAPLTAQGTPFKREVDGLIRFFRSTTAKNHALADGSCRHTAMVLAAMGHSHRLYSLADGPVVRNPIQFLFSCRQSDGSFADKADKDAITTTRWVMEALGTLAPDTYEGELATGASWLERKGASGSIFLDLRVDAASLAKAATSVGRGPIMQDGKPDMAANVHALVTLVRGQAAKRAVGAAAKPPTWSALQQKGFDFLLRHQDKGQFFMMIPVGENRFIRRVDLGLTGMGLASLLTKPAALRTPAEQTVINSGLAFVIESQNEHGGFGEEMVNYTTCAAVMALSKANRPDYRKALDKAQRFILALQNSEERGYNQSDRDFGSIGYGGDERGDLSNLQMAVEALRKSGLPEGDESLAKAIVFLQRTQNLKGSFQGKTRDDTGKPVSVESGNDGGSAYYPGNSPAGYVELTDGTKIPRSYGSMTYALLKTYTLCGVAKDDPRVLAAVKWIEKNYDLDTNPGADPRLGEKARYQGLYYYYMVMAQALSTAGIDTLAVPAVGDSKPAVRQVDWRKELKAKILSMQNPNGGWLNEKNGRWWEESDLVCTTYAMLALENCR